MTEKTTDTGVTMAEAVLLVRGERPTGWAMISGDSSSPNGYELRKLFRVIDDRDEKEKR